MKNIYFSVLLLLLFNTCFSQNIHIVAGFGINLGDNGPAYFASFADPQQICLDDTGNIYIADRDNSRIRKINAHTGIITTIAGSGTYGYNGDGIIATTASFRHPCGVAVDDTGNIYIADASNNRVRKVLAATGTIITIAGNGVQGYNGDNIVALNANLNYPNYIALDDSNNIYISDAYNFLIRKLNVYTGILTNIAGNGNQGYAGEGVPALSAQFSWVTSICLDTAKNIYIADVNAHRVRKIDAGTGLINTIAGTGFPGYNGDGIAAISATLDSPYCVAVDDTGNIYIADCYNRRIRKVNIASGIITSMFTPPPYNGNNGITKIFGISLDRLTNMYFFDDDWLKMLCGIDTAGVIVTANPGTQIAPGQQVTFTAVINNGGYHPTYQWQKNSIDITGETNSNYTTNTLTNNDTISCAVTSDMPCIDSTHLYGSNPLVIQINSGVANVENNAFNIFPNPNNGNFTVNVEDNKLSKNSLATLVIYNATGKAACKEQINITNGRAQIHKILPAGFYTLTITDDKGYRYMEKLIIRN